MANYRVGRINEELMKALCEIVRTVKDPRVSSAFVSITAVDCTPDLKNAKVYSDAMDWTLPEIVESALVGCRFSLPDMQAALRSSPLDKEICVNLLDFLQEQSL